MSYREPTPDISRALRDLDERLSGIERGRGRSGVNSFAAVRLGPWVLETQGANLVARKADGTGTPVTLAAG